MTKSTDEPWGSQGARRLPRPLDVRGREGGLNTSTEVGEDLLSVEVALSDSREVPLDLRGVGVVAGLEEGEGQGTGRDEAVGAVEAEVRVGVELLHGFGEPLAIALALELAEVLVDVDVELVDNTSSSSRQLGEGAPGPTVFAKEGASLSEPGGEASHALEVDGEALSRLGAKKLGTIVGGAVSVDEPGANGRAKLVPGDDLGNVDAEDGGVDGSVEIGEIEVLANGDGRLSNSKSSLKIRDRLPGVLVRLGQLVLGGPSIGEVALDVGEALLKLGLLLRVELDGGLQGALGEIGDGSADGRVDMGSELGAKLFERVASAGGRMGGLIIGFFSSPSLAEGGHDESEELEEATVQVRRFAKRAQRARREGPKALAKLLES